MADLVSILKAMRGGDGYLLSPHFTLREMCRSGIAVRMGIDNAPTSLMEVEALRALAINVLEPVRIKFNAPVDVESGLRILEVNGLVGGQIGSQHVTGEAADIHVKGVANLVVLLWIRDHLEFDQLILEHPVEGEPFAGWIHVSFRAGRNRRQVLHIDNKGTHAGLPTWTKGAA